ncbi:hypothetical protein [Phenylobacterium sp.]|uniref:hypothetical protein n=1 Tax=Phenylobacterium sp. TaxID=1871053 RepID=UPI0025CF1E1C|nr:hypothetical protein [Phenylobacterium sp.]
MSGGTNQAERYPAGLSAERFRVDETPAHELLTMSRRFARELDFVGEDGRVDGDWRRLLDGDETVMLARGLSRPLRQHERAFLDDFTGARPHGVADRLSDLARWLAHWFGDLTAIDRPRTKAFSERVEQVVTQFLAPELAPATASTIAEATTLIDDRLDPILRPGAARSRRRAQPPTLREMRRLYFALLKSIARVQAMAEQEWRRSLQSGAHEPAAALLLAFLQMFERVQQQMNRFTDRLTDFYYRDVLRMQPHGAEADSVLLVFQRDPTYAAEVIVPAGARFLVPASAAGPAVEFLADEALYVTETRVDALCTLRLQRDRLISPEREFAYVTRVKIDAFSAQVGSAGPPGAQSAPLFGGDVRGSIRKGENARIGLAVAAPVLWLKEGEREVRLTIGFAFDDDPQALLAQLREASAAPEPDPAAKATAFFRVLGRLFGRWVLPDAKVLTTADLKEIRALAAGFIDLTPFERKASEISADMDGVSPTDPLFLFLGAVEPDEASRDLIRDEVLESLFRVALSTADGWFECPRVVLQPGSGATSMTLALHLGNDDPPIEACTAAVHGPDLPTGAPVMRLLINDQAAFYPLSLLDGAMLDSLGLQVAVSGVRDLRAYNQLGPLDPSRPFMPFGPIPNIASYLVIAAPELARKYVTALTVCPEWVGLPPDGFADYYDGYGARMDDGAFTATTAILRDGLWIESDLPPQPLFTTQGSLQGRPIDFGAAALVTGWRPTDADLILDQNARSGFFRVQLAAPKEGFGHQIYPTALTNALSAKTRSRKAQPMPNPPYTPLLGRVTLTYAASTRITIGRANEARTAGGAERVLYLRPFGVEQIYPYPSERRRPVAPGFGRDGNLYIGLSGRDLRGVLTLLFDLRRDAADEAEARQTPRPTIEWSWLTEDEWRPLDRRRVLSDTTSGFLTSGVVTLDLPPDIRPGNRLMPSDLYWLRAATDASSGCFAGLKGVTAQTLRATRVLSAAAAPEAPLAPRSIDMKSAALPGILALQQPEASYGLRCAERQDEERTRIGERLRHKNRASTPWDYERLVLERFPNVFKARCLSNRADRTGAAAPGQVLVVVAPAAHRNDSQYASRAMRLDPLELDSIERYLQARSSPFAKVRVRNASYDLIQVRCRVALRPGAHGDILRRINAAIVAHLSPWHDGGYLAHFDWEVRGEDIEDCVRRLPEVESVTGISLVHVCEDQSGPAGSSYLFEDTALPPPAYPDGVSPTRAQHRHPWSMALPMDEHFIDIVTDDGVDETRWTGVAAGAGVAGVQIGSTFVVGRGANGPADRTLVEDDA